MSVKYIKQTCVMMCVALACVLAGDESCVLAIGQQSKCRKENTAVDVCREMRKFISALSNSEADALQFFSDKAFSNKSMLRESCAGYIQDSERESRDAVRAGVCRFLAEIRSNLPLRAQLPAVGKAVVECGKNPKYVIVNDQKVDGYAMIRLPLSEVGKIADSIDIVGVLGEKVSSSNVYVTIMPIGDGVCYFVWIPTPGEWRIVHAGLFCM